MRDSVEKPTSDKIFFFESDWKKPKISSCSTDENALKTRVERRARFGRPVGSGEALRGGTSSCPVGALVRRVRTAGFACSDSTSRCVGATAQLDYTRTHIREARVGFESPPATRSQAQGRAVPLAGASVRANPDPATLGRTRELAKSARPRTRERRSHARARPTRGVRGGRLRGKGRVEAFRGSAGASALSETGDTARARTGSRFPRRIRPRPSTTVYHEEAGGVEDAQAVHDYQEQGIMDGARA